MISGQTLMHAFYHSTQDDLVSNSGGQQQGSYGKQKRGGATGGSSGSVGAASSSGSGNHGYHPYSR